MAFGNNGQVYTNLPRQYSTLADVSQQVEHYPLIVSPVQSNYELLGLSPGVDILLEKPKHIKFARIRILDYDDKEKKSQAFDEDSLNVRRRYIGQEFLIPTGFRGKFKLISNTGRYATLISVSQIIQDLPRYIVIGEKTMYTTPGQSHPSACIAAGTRLEVKRTCTIENSRYIECFSDTFNMYKFSEDYPLNCTCVNDPDDHMFQDIIDKSILLPKTVKFLNISNEEVLKTDEDDANTLLKLLEGPIQIMQTYVRRKFFVAWMKREDGCMQTVGLIPDSIWETISIETKIFDSDSKKQKYIQDNFGEKFDSSFLDNGLYTIKPETTCLVWTRPPSRHPACSPAVDGDDTYVKLWIDAPTLPPRPKSFKKPSLPNTSIQDAKSRQDLGQHNNLLVQGREQNQRASLKVSRSFQAQTESDSIKEKKGFDKVDVHYNIEDKAWHSLKETNKRQEVESDSTGNKKFATLPDLKKLSKPNHNEELFYNYSIEELADCFKFCGLEKFADDCRTNKLDGNFFRNFNIDDLMSEPFCLKKFDVSKIKMIILNGWRPKSDPK